MKKANIQDLVAAADDGSFSRRIHARRLFGGFACTALTAASLLFADSYAAEMRMDTNKPLGPPPPITASDVSAFISGHSLTAMPFPVFLSEMTSSTGRTMDWSMQQASGSSIKDRLVMGHSFHGSSKPYDILIVTEMHALLDSLMWHETSASLIDLHNRFIAAAPTGQTYFFTPWLGMADRKDPRSWIDYERRAFPVWACIIEHLNERLANDGRTDRIHILPASLALAFLIERLQSLPKPTHGAGPETDQGRWIASIFDDDVHLSALGNYYLSVISTTWIVGAKAEELPMPTSVNGPDADLVRTIAGEFATHFDQAQLDGRQACQARARFAFIGHYMRYTNANLSWNDFPALTKQMVRLVRFAWHFRRSFHIEPRSS